MQYKAEAHQYVDESIAWCKESAEATIMIARVSLTPEALAAVQEESQPYHC